MFKSKSRKLKAKILEDANRLKLDAREKTSMSPSFVVALQMIIDDLEVAEFVKDKDKKVTLKILRSNFDDVVSAYNSGDETSAIKSCDVFRNNIKKVKYSSLNKRNTSLNNSQKYSLQEFWNLVSQRLQGVQDNNTKEKESLKNENEKYVEQLTERLCAIAIIEIIRDITHIELSYNDNLFVVVDKDDFYVVDKDGMPLCELTLAEFCEGLTKYRDSAKNNINRGVTIYRDRALEEHFEKMKAEEVDPDDLGDLAEYGFAFPMTETKKVYPVCCEESDEFISCQTGKASGEPDSSEVTLSSSDRRDVEDFVFLTCGLDFKMRFKFKSGGYVVKGIGRCKAPFIRIPSEFNGVHVVGIADSAFEGVESVKSVTIPEGVKFIGSRAFYGCKNLFDVVISSTVKTIGDEAFSNCGDLDEITISDGVKSIGNAAFSDCEFLESVAIPDSVTEIGRDLFNNCENLESVRLPAGITEIKEGMFSRCGISDFDIPDSVVSIDDGAFENAFLEKVTLPASVKSIGKNAFNDCLFLASVNLAQGLISIGDSAFYDCNSLTNIVIPESVTYIGDEAFGNCEKLIEVQNLSSLDIKAGDDKYGEVALYAKNVYRDMNGKGEFLISEDGYEFYKFKGKYYLIGYNGSETDLHLPNSIEGNGYEIYNCAFNICISITSVFIPNNISKIGARAFANHRALTSVTIGDGVTTIGSHAFFCCVSLSSIIFPDSVISIADSAFGGCTSLSSLIIPDSVVLIDKYAFFECSLLKSVKIGDGVTMIGDGAFQGCASLTHVAFGKSTKVISGFAFSRCPLKSIIIPCTVDSVGFGAFLSETLTSVYFLENPYEKPAPIKVDMWNESLTSATKYYYSEKKPSVEGNFWHYVDGEPAVWRDK